MVVPAAIMGGSALVGGALNYMGARNANKATVESSKTQMDFQERMSNTAYQRAVEDMNKAGINPILAYNQGGASSPGGSFAPQQNEMSGAVSSAIDAGRAFAEMKNLAAQNANIKSQTVLNEALAGKASSDQIRSWVDTVGDLSKGFIPVLLKLFGRSKGISPF